MMRSIPDSSEREAIPTDEISRLRERVNAVQKVTEMAVGGVSRLLGHTSQLEATLDPLFRRVESLPDSSEIRLLERRIESLQAMLDWVATRSDPDSIPLDFLEVQTRLSACRVRLVNLHSEMRQAASLAGSLQEARQTLTSLANEAETLESTKSKAEALSLESRALLVALESANQPE
jgi:chromosome segregation ATPase